MKILGLGMVQAQKTSQKGNRRQANTLNKNPSTPIIRLTKCIKSTSHETVSIAGG